jgi:hypothetical protein
MYFTNRKFISNISFSLDKEYYVSIRSVWIEDILDPASSWPHRRDHALHVNLKDHFGSSQNKIPFYRKQTFNQKSTLSLIFSLVLSFVSLVYC